MKRRVFVTMPYYYCNILAQKFRISFHISSPLNLEQFLKASAFVWSHCHTPAVSPAAYIYYSCVCMVSTNQTSQQCTDFIPPVLYGFLPVSPVLYGFFPTNPLQSQTRFTRAIARYTRIITKLLQIRPVGDLF